MLCVFVVVIVGVTVLVVVIVGGHGPGSGIGSVLHFFVSFLSFAKNVSSSGNPTVHSSYSAIREQGDHVRPSKCPHLANCTFVYSSYA